ncbi:MAG: hypothetical protein B6229_09990 [Spirochaetaceae bacterium 4572_7]|nr:MAG: hypothetical protein B6229_09990 [Spirochaetaceae bacterium 4572_7]
MCIIKQDEKSLKFHLLLLTILSIIATYSRLLITSNFVSMLLILPSIIALGFLFKIFFKKGWNNLEENNHLNTLLSNKNKILSTLTHELRTPLTVIKTSNELILEGRSGEITDLQRSLLTSSLENTIRLISLAENILSQIKVEFSWFTMKKQILDIKTLIRKVTTDMTPFLEAKKIHLHYSYPALLSKSIGDKRWIQQVILNLIHNSSKNIQEDSEIEINVKENEQCIVISVHDYGMGIKNKEISHVFNEFYQSTDPVKDLTNGTGLGLTIVKNIIEKHGGNVYISSMHGLGTTVSFTLPIYRGVISEIFSPNN